MAFIYPSDSDPILSNLIVIQIKLSYAKLAELNMDDRLLYILQKMMKKNPDFLSLVPVEAIGTYIYFHTFIVCYQSTQRSHINTSIIGFFSRFRKDFVENELLQRNYKPGIFHGRLSLIKATEYYQIDGLDDPLTREKFLGWDQLYYNPNRKLPVYIYRSIYLSFSPLFIYVVGISSSSFLYVCFNLYNNRFFYYTSWTDIALHETVGDHDSMVFNPQVIALAEKIKMCLS